MQDPERKCADRVGGAFELLLELCVYCRADGAGGGYRQALQNKTYGAWFAGYLSEEYRKANQDLIDRMDALAASIFPQEENRLCELF